jgi:hypothetical protein
MRRPALAFLAFAALAAGSAFAAERSSANRTAYIERAWPSVYEKVQNLFDEEFSKTNDAVILRVDAGKPVSALALKRNESGDYTLTYAVQFDGKFHNLTADLPANVGDQILRAIELKLHRHVLIGTQPRDYTKREGDMWVFHRNAQNRTSTAVILFEATLDNPDAATFVEGLLGGLQKLISAEDADRELLLAELDRLATRIILAESP